MDRDGVGLAQRIDISAAALEHNLRLFRDLLDRGTLLAAVVKANAYGHGMEQIAPLAEKTADWLAVHSATEARRIREMGVKAPLLVMGYISEQDLHDLDADIHVFVSTEEVLRSIGEYRRERGVSLPVHLKVDTGAKRQGFSADEVRRACELAGSEGLEVVGVATHFANIEDTLNHEFARHQLDLFHDVVDTTRRALNSRPPYIHAACSAAALLFPETDFTLARVGISMYGHWPSRETELTWILDHGRDGLRLEPVLSWHTVVGQIQRVEKGETVGYGRTWTALRTTRLAVLPVGYADGYGRCLGNRSRVIIRGRFAPVVGRVCMNVSMVDVTDVPDVRVGDDVVLIGRQGGIEVAVEELAELSDTINYEFLARLSPDIPRTVAD
jgi:alanine racemase